MRIKTRSNSITQFTLRKPADKGAVPIAPKCRRCEKEKKVHTKTSSTTLGRLRQVGLRIILAALLLTVLVPGGRSYAQEKQGKPAAKSLYQRMGGYDVIAGVVDDFINQLKADPAFKRFGGGRAMDSLKRTRQLVVDQICMLAGGPCIYIGRDMKTAHAGLQITDKEWDSSINMFKNSLDKFKVQGREKQEFIAMLQKLKPDIAEKPKYETAKKKT